MRRAVSTAMVLAVAGVIVAGCGARKQSRELYGVRYEVDDVVLEGVTRFKKRAFLAYLHVGETSWLPFTETRYYNEALAPADIARILELYRAYGYRDAEVTAYRILERKRDEVDVLIAVQEGRPVLIDAIAVAWPDDASAAGEIPEPLRTEIASLVSLRAGDPLEIPTLEENIDAVLMALKSKGYPLADADARVTMSGKWQASVVLAVRPGPFARVDGISVYGLRTVSRQSVMNEIDFAMGEPFSPALLARIERRIFAMDLFSAVEVSPAREVTDGKVALRVSVTEAKLQSIKVGVSLAFESARWDQGIRTLYSHRNFFHRQWRLDTRFRVGYAELPWPFEMQDHGPTVQLEPRLTKKGWLEKRLVWTLAPAIELGVEEGYQFYAPSTHIGLSRLFGEMFLAEISHYFKFFDFFNVSKTLGANRTLLGLDYRDPYLLSYIELNTVLYLTDRLLEPRNGVVIGNRYQLAGGPFGGHYDFHKIEPQLKAYWQVSERVQLAFRAETGYIFPFGKAGAAPFNMQFYLGGADTVRGWGQRRLSPKTVDCPEGSDDKCRAIPIGGKTEVLLNVELRVRTYKMFYLATYVDVGDVQEGALVYRPAEWNVSAGGGLRYESPIGKLRLDVGARLNDTPLSEGEDRWAFHLGLGEAF